MIYFRCSICGNTVSAEPPNIAKCSKCGAKYLFKYSKKERKRKYKGHYIFAGF